MPHYPSEVEYSDKYMDSKFEYRHVTLTKEMYRRVQEITTASSGPGVRLLSESEWRWVGIMQSRGWEHYHTHR
jgi:cyclin-dependent kinase regulatory subunit CKS1